MEISTNDISIYDRLTDTMKKAWRYMVDNDALFDTVMKLQSHDLDCFLHCERVARLSILFGIHAELSDEVLFKLALGGLVHDIGKLCIPVEILRKTSQLSKKEYASIHKHSAYGRALLTLCDVSDSDVLDIAGEHHERINGSGYPDGRRGINFATAGVKSFSMDSIADIFAEALRADEPKEINALSMVVAVVDVFDALVSARCYKEPYTFEEAISKLRKSKGFDSDMIDILDAVVSDKDGEKLVCIDYRPRC